MRQRFFTWRVVKARNRPREGLDASSLQTPRAMLDRDLSSLLWLKMFLPSSWLGSMAFKGPSPHKPFYDSIIPWSR